MLKNRKICILLVFMLLINILPTYIAFAAYDGEFIINDSKVVITENGTYKVTGNDKTSNTIYVSNDLDNVTIDIENLNIRHSSSFGVAPIEVGTNTHLTLNFINENVLIGYNTPAISVISEDSSVTISGTGTLRASGGEQCAGIGGSKTMGSVIINSGNITAISGTRSAGIGVGYNGKGGSVTINGGTVTSTGYGGGAGIGAGYGGDFGEITINGGTVSATSTEGGAGIGGGYRGKGGKITINGGDITSLSRGGGYSIGSGRYLVGSEIYIDKNANVNAFSASGIAPIEETDFTTNAFGFAGVFSSNPFKTDDTFEFKSDAGSKNVTFPAQCQELYTTLPAAGTYTVTCSDGDLTYKDGSKKYDKFEIADTYKLFKIFSKCACELTAPDFLVDDILLSASTSSTNSITATTKKVTLKAKNSEFTRSDTCTLHTKSSMTIKYKYEIIEDRSQIATLSGSSLTVKVANAGVYSVTVRATAYVGDGELSAYTDTPIKITKQVAAEDIEDDDIYIDANGVYNIKGTTKHNAIIVASDLLDVTLVLSGVNIDLSLNSGNNKSPITIGAGSNVTISNSGTTTLKSRKDNNVINLQYAEGYGANTTVNLRGTGTLSMYSKGKASCVGGANSEVYFFDSKVKMSAEDSPAVSAAKVFVAEDADLYALSEQNKSNPISGTFITVNKEGFKPAYVIQAKFKKALDITKTSTVTFKNSKTKKTVSISDVTKDTKSVAVVLPDEGYYTAYYKASSSDTLQDLSYTDNKESLLEFNVSSHNTAMDFEFSQCKCKVSAPKFKISAITIPYDEYYRSFYLEAEDAKFKFDENCTIHNEYSNVDYKYTIVEDDDDIATLSDSRIKLEVYNPGKYTVKVRATAYVDGVSATKDATLNITKLTQAETEKKRGEEHMPYISGYSDGSFKPDLPITRAETARLMVNVLDLKYISEDSDLTDISDRNWFYDDVVLMQSKSILTGYEDGTFRPDNNITRAEFCVVVSRALGVSGASGKSKLSDVTNHWAAPYINALVKKKVITGYTDNSFKPDASITRAEAVKIINALLGRTPNSDKVAEAGGNNNFYDLKKKHWAYYEILEASEKHYKNDWH